MAPQDNPSMSPHGSRWRRRAAEDPGTRRGRRRRQDALCSTLSVSALLVLFSRSAAAQVGSFQTASGIAGWNPFDGELPCSGSLDCFQRRRQAIERRIAATTAGGDGGAVVQTDCSDSFRRVACPDVRALLTFKAANIDPWGALASWVLPCNASAPAPSPRPRAAAALPRRATASAQCQRLSAIVCSQWYGVTCNAALRVTNLTLNGNAQSSGFLNDGGDSLYKSLWGNFSLGYSLPPEIGDLAELRVLDLQYNRDGNYMGGLIGPLPKELSKLTNLVSLNLVHNRFWGPIPGELSALRSLSFLALDYNNFTGSLPRGLGALVQLTSLSVAKLYGLSGSLPAELGQLNKLQSLQAAGTHLAGSIPSSFSGLTALTQLDLTLCGITGDFPPWIGRLSGIQKLYLSQNSLQGELPAGLGKLWSLDNLDLSQNNLTGEISGAFVDNLCSKEREDAKLNPSQTLLSGLILSNNQLGGSFPTRLTQCTALNTLYLSNNSLSGDFPPLAFFTALPGLTDVQVQFNRLGGVLPRALFAKAPWLTSLFIQGNRIVGPMPPMACTQQQLSFYAAGNQLTGTLARILRSATLPNCTTESVDGPPAPADMVLDFSDNRLSGPVPALAFTLPLGELHLDGNQLEGPLPAKFKCHKTLQFFTASRNSLQGPLPSALGSCVGMQSLDLSYNALSGTIPLQIKGIGAKLQMLNLQHNQLSGPLPGSLNFLRQLASFNASHNALEGPLPASIAQLPNLKALDLSHNRIAGGLVTEMGNYSALENMDLHGNALTGPLPITFAPPNLPLLTFLDLSENQLSGPIPYGFVNTSGASLDLRLKSNNLSGPVPGGPNSTFALAMPPEAVANNSFLCGALGYQACPELTTGSSLSAGAIAGIAVGAAVGLLLIALAAFWFVRKRSEWAGGTMLVFEKLDFPLTIDDILEATEDFSDDHKLGRGGFGTVYRAVLQDGRTVAIKRLATQSAQGDREFQAEMQTLGNIRHRNLVTLVAAYIAPAPSSERLLIYNFLSGGSLDQVLSTAKDMPKDSPYREWEVRRRIALDSARGLKYLHHDCTPRIIHRDMKPANVLMDDQCVAYVADFGLAREVDTTKSHMSTAVFGTIGYLAPEYHQFGRLTFKSDVFAYGVMLLQLITGKQPTDEDVAERGLARWVGASSAGSIIDDRMEYGPYLNQILGAIKLGLLCTSRVPADRPTMAEVVHLLENLDDFAKGFANADGSTQG